MKLGQGALYGYMLTTYTRFNPVMGNDEEMPRVDKIQGSPEFIDLIYRVAKIDKDAANYMCANPGTGTAKCLGAWAFWDETPQGSGYWMKIYQKLQRLTDEPDAITDIQARLSELEDRFDSLIDTQQKREDSTGSSDRLMTFAEAIDAMRMGYKVRRDIWRANHYVSADNDGGVYRYLTLNIDSVLADDWTILED